MNSRKNKAAVMGALLSVAVGLSAFLTACQGPQPQPGTAQGETLPSPAEAYEFTSVEPYMAALETAFTDVMPVSADTLTYSETEGGVKIDGYSGNAVKVMLPDAIDGVAVVAVGEEAFKDHTALTELYIPDSVKRIGRGALQGCSSLSVLRTPVAGAVNTTMDEDGGYAYSFGAIFGAADHTDHIGSVPDSLKTVILGEPVTEIPDYAFSSCKDLVCVAFPNTLTSVGEFAFYGCASLAYADLSSTMITRVGEYAFAGCTALLRFQLPSTVATVEFGVVKGCATMEAMTLPYVGRTHEESGYIGFLFGAAEYTLTEGHIPVSLLSVTLNEGVDAIPDNAFYGCSYLREVHLPSTVKTVGRRAFYGCARLTEITVPDHVIHVGDEAFAHCERLQTIGFGSSLTTLGVQTFLRCLSLQTVTLPEGVKDIPASCFAGCISLESVVAPGVTSSDGVGDMAYRGCDKLIDAPFLPVETDTETA